MSNVDIVQRHDSHSFSIGSQGSNAWNDEAPQWFYAAYPKQLSFPSS